MDSTRLDTTDRTPKPSSTRSPKSQHSGRARAVAGLLTVLAGSTALTGSAAYSTGGAQAASVKVPFSNFSSCPKLMAYLQSLALPQIGPYGLGGGPIMYMNARGGINAPVPVQVMPAVPIPTTAPPFITAAPAPEATIVPSMAPSAAKAAPVAPVAADSVSGSVSGPAVVSAAGSNTSMTNVQEVGIDEGDQVETDGRYVYTAIGNGGVRIVDTSSGTQVATIANYGSGAEPQLILDGDRLLVSRALYDQQGPETIAEIWSVADPTKPQMLSRTHLEGEAMAVRSIDHRARIVLNTSMGYRLKFVQPAGGNQKDLDNATAANKAILKRATVGDWVPRIYDEDANGLRNATRPALDCREVGKPADPSGLGMVWVASIDLNGPARAGSVATGSGGVVASGGIVYSSARNLYVATTPQFINPMVVRGRLAMPIRQNQNVNTAIHSFDLSPADGASYQASGVIRGTLLNQFSMSENNGVLRVAATTPNEGFGSRQESTVHILSRAGRSLTEIGAVGGLGQNENIQGVRFLGDLGYVVTFRQTDPLYVLDLRDPRSPKVAGVLKVPGYSAYLHPMAPGYVIGVGQDATDSGQRLGTMVQVFDVRDPYYPKLSTKIRIGGNSEAEYDHHAFLWWAQSGDAFVPSQSYGTTGMDASVVVAHLTTDSAVERGRIRHAFTTNPGIGAFPTDVPITTFPVPTQPVVPGPLPPITSIVPQRYFDPIRRTMIVNGRVVTVSVNGVKVSELSSLKELSFARLS